MTHRAAFVLALSLVAAPAFAQTPAPAMPGMAMDHPACAVTSDATLPPALAGWTARTPLAAGGALPLGKGVDAQLQPVASVKFPVAPGKVGAATSYAGLFDIVVSEAGDYQVSLGGGAWLEMTDGAGLVASTAHAPGVACTTLKKLVVFPLTAGRHVLEISDSAAPTLAVMITRVVK